MNVLMISIGDSILCNPLGDALKRQIKYANALGFIDMIVYSPKKHQLKAKHYDNLSIYPTASLSMLTFIFDVIRLAKKIIQEKKINVITTQDPFGTALSAYILKKIYHIPLHIQNHSSFLDNQIWIDEKPLLFTLFNKLSHFTLKKADRLRVVNSQEKQKYINILGIDANIIDIAPVPVDTSFWSDAPSQKEKDAFCKQYGIDSTKPVLSWAGRPVEFKNLPYLYKAVSQILSKFQVNFLIAGEMKNSFWNLRVLEEKYNIKPIYLGLLTHQELKIMYYVSDVYLHSSNYEGFGLVVSDAQACGTVVVSRNTAGSKDIIDDGQSGYIIDGDEREFSAKIVELLQNNTPLTVIQKKFDKEKMFDAIVESIQKSEV